MCIVTSFMIGAPVRGKLRALSTYWPACDGSIRLISGGGCCCCCCCCGVLLLLLLSASPVSLAARLRFGRPFRPGPVALRGSGSTSSSPAGVLGISCLIESAGDSSSRDRAAERPRLLDDGVLSSRFRRLDRGLPSSSPSGTFWSRLARVVLSPPAAVAVLRPLRRDGAPRPVDSKDSRSSSLIGLTSSGRGRSGEVGD